MSVSFDNPATDAMGYDHVEGKLYCGRDSIQLQFKQRDRAFRKNEPQTVEIEYGEVEDVEFVSKWFQPKRLIFETRSPEKLAAFPGAGVGRLELIVTEDSRKEAKKVANLIRFRQSEAFLEESEQRLGRASNSE
ncbi:MAG: hypothetical protein WD342_10460 [Verrucomicrobiales bacterium]